MSNILDEILSLRTEFISNTRDYDSATIVMGELELRRLRDSVYKHILPSGDNVTWRDLIGGRVFGLPIVFNGRDSYLGIS